MYYFLTPLHTHIDLGFGATGNAFKHAADKLEAMLPERGGILSDHLPINYLRRHAVELFLKSAITIIHRRLCLPHGDVPPTGEPRALVNGEWIPFTRLHSVKRLWTYLKALFQEQKAFFDSVVRVDWTFPSEVDTWIDAIEEHDPRSTFFRYPNPRERESDALKTVMVEARPEEILERMTTDPNSKQFILLLENDQGEVTRGYYYGEDALVDLSRILKECAEDFYGTHAALRAEVCGGA